MLTQLEFVEGLAGASSAALVFYFSKSSALRVFFAWVFVWIVRKLTLKLYKNK